MNGPQRTTLAAVRTKLTRLIGGPAYEGKRVFEECLALLTSMNVVGPTRTILDFIVQSKRLEPWIYVALARPALRLARLSRVEVVGTRAEAARLSALQALVSQRIEYDHDLTIEVLFEPACDLNPGVLEQIRDVLSSEQRNIDAFAAAAAAAAPTPEHEAWSVNLALSYAITHLQQAAVELEAAAKSLRAIEANPKGGT